MSDLSLTILPEKPNDADAIERLHERTFGPGRFVLSAYRLREHVDHLLDLSFTARIGTLLVGSVRQLPICIGDTPALILGPLLTEFPLSAYFRDSEFWAYFLNILGEIHYHLPGLFIHNPTTAVNGQLWTVPFELAC